MIFGGSGTDTAHSVIETSDGGFAAAGATDSYGPGDLDFYVLKTDSTGDVLWSRSYGGPRDDIAYSLAETPDGGLAVVGSTKNPALNLDIYLLKIDSQGAIVFEKFIGSIGDDIAYSINATSDGGLIIAGVTTTVSNPGDAYLIKTDSSGNILWEKTFGSASDYEEARSVVETSDNGYALAGRVQPISFRAESSLYVVKTDSLGNLTWEQEIGKSSDCYFGYSIIETSDKNLATVGGSCYGELYMAKLASDGTTLWTKSNGAFREGRSLAETPAGDLAVAVTLSPPGTDSDITLLKTDSNGNIQWEKTFGQTGTDLGFSIKSTSDSGFIIAGQIETFSSSGTEVYLIKTDSSGVAY